MQKLLAMQGVTRTRGDMCAHGMQATDEKGTALVLKPIGWATNSPYIAEEVSARCSNKWFAAKHRHRHVHLMGGKEQQEQQYILQHYVRQYLPVSKLR